MTSIITIRFSCYSAYRIIFMIEQTNLNNSFSKTAPTIGVKNPQAEDNLMIDLDYLMMIMMIKFWSREEKIIVVDEIETDYNGLISWKWNT